MTQQPAPPPDRGAVRSAVEALLRTCVDLEHQADEVARQSRERVGGVVGGLAGVRVPSRVVDLGALAQEIDGLGRALDADLAQRLDEARQPYVTEIHALLGLLAPLHGLTAIPALVPAGPGSDLSAQFPAGFAHDYVRDLVTDIDGSAQVEPADAAGVPAPSDDDLAAAMQAVRDTFGESFADDGMALLTDSRCHAMQRHGPHITDQAQLARLLCLKDPAGQETWQILPSAAVWSEHQCGPASGGFATPRAFTRPLEAVLAAAGSRPGGLQQFLSDNTAPKAKGIALHVSVTLAGLASGDASGYRGTGTGTRDRRDDWVAAREYGLARGRTTVYGVAYDPLADGPDPGALMVFRRDIGGPWRLVTYFPVDKQRPNSKRLEDLG